jgi:ubiquinone/menaquinone biosynthesis methyltransferase
MSIGRAAGCRTFNGTAHLSNNSNADTTADFGFKEVKSSQKQDMVKEVFSKVAQKYDIMNDLMSAGAHRLWKDDFVSMMGLGAAARIQSDKVPRFLDVAGGTGDIAFRIVETLFSVYGHSTVLKAGPAGAAVDDASKQVVVCDINPDMLAVGRQRAPIQLQSNKSDVVGFVEGNAEALPFPDESFDVYTIAFGLRNVTNKEVRSDRSLLLVYGQRCCCCCRFRSSSRYLPRPPFPSSPLRTDCLTTHSCTPYPPTHSLTHPRSWH